MDRPLVSIVMPAYNVEDFLSDAVESVLAQTFMAWELVIVNDGSTDSTGAIADGYARHDDRVRAIHRPNGGVSRARNAGLALVDSDTSSVIFLDSDDVWEDDALVTLWTTLARDSTAVAVYGFARHFVHGRMPQTVALEDADGYRRRAVDSNRRVSVPADAPASFEVLSLWPCIATGGQILIRRTAIDGQAPFEPDILSQDWLFWLRLSLRGPIQPVDHFVLRKREREGSLMRRPEFRTAELTVRRLLVMGPEMTPSRVRTARVGHRYAALERLGWSRAALERGHPIDAARQLRRCLVAAIGYGRLRRLYAHRIDDLSRTETDSNPEFA
jgi:glycosyltransferase involved in cell wall biosynthesis